LQARVYKPLLIVVGGTMENPNIVRIKTAIASVYELTKLCTARLQETQHIGELLNQVVAESRAGVIGRKSQVE